MSNMIRPGSMYRSDVLIARQHVLNALYVLNAEDNEPGRWLPEHMEPANTITTRLRDALVLLNRAADLPDTDDQP